MVLGLRSKHRKGASLQVDYLVHVLEIKPWPPSQSLRSTQSVLLQWENGDQISGSRSSSVGDAKIEFKESFTLSSTLCREKKANDKFQKNFLEFHLYEPRKDKATKGQLLGTAIINLADYGIIDNILTVSAPLNCKKSSKIVIQPFLFVKIQSIDKDSSNSSSKGSLSKQVSLEKDGHESVLESVNEEIDDESEIASFTDDDVSSHSSRTLGSSAFEATGHSPSQNGKDALESTGWVKEETTLPLGVEPAISAVDTWNGAFREPNGGPHTLPSVDLSSDVLNPVNNRDNLSKLPERNMTSTREELVTPFLQSPFSSTGFRDINGEPRTGMGSSDHENLSRGFHEEIAYSNGKSEDAQQSVENNFVKKVAGNVVSSQPSGDDDGQAPRQGKNGQLKAITVSGVHVGRGEREEKRKHQEIGQDEQILEEKIQFSEDNLVGKFLASRKQDKLRSNTLTPSRKLVGVQDSTISKLKHMKSVQLPKASGFSSNGHIAETGNKLDKLEDAHHTIRNNEATESKEATNGSSQDKTEWKSRIEMLEEELRETAAIEVGLYSIVAEHGSSTNKVHAPARRLSRFYLHSCKEMSQEKRANAARAAISGLVLVSKACGNDVPRLTFWLSNSVMLRAVVIQAVGEMSLLDSHCIRNDGGGRGSARRSSRKQDESSPVGEGKNSSMEEFDDWQDPETFIIALEKVEAWIFSRIVESVWWQTLTPHMQCSAAKTSGRSSRKNSGIKNVLGNQEQGNFSVELWKKAFKDACERLCPIRAGGHECGCLPVLARLVMEQLVGRLDVAMFNAILRESAEEMPTDPLSDPIGDLRVLPVPAGRSSFGAGAQLKNAIGNWSRCLTDLFGIEDNDSLEDDDNLGNEKEMEVDTSFKAFRLLNSLSDLMMLPFEMLADKSMRKEVCPTLSAPLIKRVASKFVPDEFCPNPVPDAVLEALDSEDAVEVSEESVTSFPCIASPTVYSPPPPGSLSGIIGEVGSQALQRSGSSVLKKSYTSDDELDELDSPLTSIISDSSRVSPTSKRPNWMPKGGRTIIRYQLLQEVWRDGE